MKQTLSVEPEHAITINGSKITLVDSIQRMLHALPGEQGKSEPFTIFRVPAHVRAGSKNLYEPRIVSIGPYHRGAERLKAMEMHKRRYLRNFLARWLPSNNNNMLGNLVDKLRTLETDARRCYVESIDLTSDEFVEMMLLDGCFILEFLLKWKDRIRDDLMWVVGWSLPLLRCDLIMLENQMPLVLLDALFDQLPDSQKIESLTSVAGRYLMNTRVSITIPEKDYCHLLHLYHSCFVPTPQNLMPATESRPPRTISCASELQNAGVTLKKKESQNFLDVSFRNGTMEIPFLSIEKSTKARFMNLIAYEQCIPMGERYLTSYGIFMDCIVNTAEDVAILQQCNILENKLASNDDAAIFFNQLGYCGYINYKEHYLAKLFSEVEEYRKLSWPRWWANLNAKYFSNPWTIISLIAASILLVLTALQTGYAIASYY